VGNLSSLMPNVKSDTPHSFKGALLPGKQKGGRLAEGGTLGKAAAPDSPDYLGAALATANSGKYDTSNAMGSSSWTLRPGADPKNPQPGDYIQTSTLAPGQQQLYDTGLAAANSTAHDIAGGNQSMSDALYKKATQYYDQNFGNQEKSLDAKLQNEGLTQGSEAYKNAMDQFQQNKNSAYDAAAWQATAGADTASSNATNRLAQLVATMKGQIPSSGGGGTQGVDYSGAAQNQYQAQLGNVNAQNAQSAQQQQMLATLAAAMIASSDRRLKSSIVAIPGGKGGLQAYEYDIFGRRERGYMAQEVLEVMPEAVSSHGGFLKVNYAMLGGRP
jgi:hypothetical protein